MAGRGPYTRPNSGRAMAMAATVTALGKAPRRRLGRGGVAVAPLGFGCMGMSDFYGPTDDAVSLATLHHAVERGFTHFDSAESYGHGHNEGLLARLLAGLPPARRADLVVASKWGVIRRPGEYARRLDGSAANLAASIEGSLRRLGLERLPLYYLHRADPDQPIEEVVGFMARLVESGKVGAIGLSEVSADTLRAACAVHPIAALQTEYSLWTRDPEAAVLPACRELGVALVAYSPLGRGFLTGAVRPEDLAADDFRRQAPRFQGDAFAANRVKLAAVEDLAAAKGCTPGQLALAWLLAQGQEVVPIPGTRRQERVDENAAAAAVHLDAGDLAALDAAMPPGAAVGERYTTEGMKGVGR